MIRTATVDGLTSVALEGNIGVEEVDPLHTALDAALGGSMEVDFSKCRSLSSSVIGTLIACHNALRAKGGRLRVRGANEDLRRLLKLMGLDRHFELV